MNIISEHKMPNSKDDQKETKPADDDMEEGTNGPNGEGAPSATINTGGDVSPKSPRTERIPKKDVTEKKKLTAAERKKLAELKRREKEEDKGEE